MSEQKDWKVAYLAERKRADEAEAEIRKAWLANAAANARADALGASLAEHSQARFAADSALAAAKLEIAELRAALAEESSGGNFGS